MIRNTLRDRIRIENIHKKLEVNMIKDEVRDK